MPRKSPVAAAEQRIADNGVELAVPRVTMRYTAEDMEKLDQFAIGLMGDTGSCGPVILEIRVRAAYLRAEVMLTVRKEIAALEA